MGARRKPALPVGRGISTQLIGGRVYSLQEAVNISPHGPYSSPEGSVAGSEGFAAAAGPFLEHQS